MKKNFIKTGAGIFGLAALLPFLAAADILQGPIITSPSGVLTILGNVLTFLSAAVAIVSVIMLIYSAILFLFAGASSAAHEKAKNVLIYAIIGIVVAVLTYSVEPFIVNFLQGR